VIKLQPKIVFTFVPTQKKKNIWLVSESSKSKEEGFQRSALELVNNDNNKNGGTATTSTKPSKYDDAFVEDLIKHVEMYEWTQSMQKGNVSFEKQPTTVTVVNPLGPVDNSAAKADTT
jgi:hypothetical protein